MEEPGPGWYLSPEMRFVDFLPGGYSSIRLSREISGCYENGIYQSDCLFKKATCKGNERICFGVGTMTQYVVETRIVRARKDSTRALLQKF